MFHPCNAKEHKDVWLVHHLTEPQVKDWVVDVIVLLRIADMP
jgi:hypothetical protein